MMASMDYATGYETQEVALVDLFATTFAMAFGADEGALIADLVRDLLTTTAEGDLVRVAASEDGSLVGAVLFSRLTYDQDPRTVFVLAPVFVAAERQGLAIGQALITHGLSALRHAGVDVVVVYGDRGLYAKVGFAPITEAAVRAPFELSHPEGWSGTSLTDCALTPLIGPARCVPALDRPDYW
ncbi:MAG: GNAT family N-acetyltransferase [Trueperaceae bacterium]|nr:GNAT family N-acetyltransferase [Trueperaceae bacterium]